MTPTTSAHLKGTSIKRSLCLSMRCQRIVRVGLASRRYGLTLETLTPEWKGSLFFSTPAFLRFVLACTFSHLQRASGLRARPTHLIRLSKTPAKSTSVERGNVRPAWRAEELVKSARQTVSTLGTNCVSLYCLSCASSRALSLCARCSRGCMSQLILPSEHTQRALRQLAWDQQHACRQRPMLFDNLLEKQNRNDGLALPATPVTWGQRAPYKAGQGCNQWLWNWYQMHLPTSCALRRINGDQHHIGASIVSNPVAIPARQSWSILSRCLSQLQALSSSPWSRAASPQSRLCNGLYLRAVRCF